MPITILKAGILDTLQDQGRYGYASYGINPGGAMDRFAAAAANFLVGNPAGAAVLEMHFPAPQAMFREDALIAIGGADFLATCDDLEIPTWQPVMVKRNTLLHFQKWKWGARAYLAVHGGFSVPPWMGSRSTHLKAAKGGYSGRPLAKDDTLPTGSGRIDITRSLGGADCRVLHWGVSDRKAYQTENELLLLPGPEWELLTAEAKQLLAEGAFTIAPNSDRMGYRLSGPPLQMTQPYEMISSGVTAGTVQLLPDGQLLVLMADHQTTGGYPRIANVISAHLPRLAQSPPATMLRFGVTTLSVAEVLLFSQMRDLKIMQRSCEDHINQLYARH